MKLLHIITSLETGGAQGVLVQFLQQLKIMGCEQAVISMKPSGELAQQIADLGIQVYEIPFSPYIFLPARDKCEQIIASYQPQIIQSWMYHADFLTLFIRNPTKIPIIWGLHHSYEHSRRNRLKLFTKIIVKINALFSRVIPQKIICCSKSALETHTRIGYAESKMIYIPNGTDVNRFKPDPQARTKLRVELGLPPETFLIGYIARYHPQKDHASFFHAANLLLEKKEDTHFVLVGNQVVADNPEIRKQMLSSKKSSHFHFMGIRTDIPMITAGVDVATLSSSGDEAFPLTIIEAMACEIPCVATDVGDVSEMIGSSGIIVPPQNPEALAEGWLNLQNKRPDERAELGRIARERVLSNFTNNAMKKQYMNVYNMVGVR
jgi:glycosyltransferase involved in cell wall biosynthesis